MSTLGYIDICGQNAWACDSVGGSEHYFSVSKVFVKHVFGVKDCRIQLSERRCFSQRATHCEMLCQCLPLYQVESLLAKGVACRYIMRNANLVACANPPQWILHRLLFPPKQCLIIFKHSSSPVHQSNPNILGVQSRPSFINIVLQS
jgi:hypothetical protein